MGKGREEEEERVKESRVGKSRDKRIKKKGINRSINIKRQGERQ
jgi:hypothetical protein